MRPLLLLAAGLLIPPLMAMAAEPPRFDLDTIDGQTVRIELTGIDAKTGIAGRVGREQTNYALDDILRIAPVVGDQE